MKDQTSQQDLEKQDSFNQTRQQSNQNSNETNKPRDEILGKDGGRDPHDIKTTQRGTDDQISEDSQDQNEDDHNSNNNSHAPDGDSDHEEPDGEDYSRDHASEYSSEREQYDDSFESDYNCYPLSLIGKSHLEHGDQIIMPVSTLESLLEIQIDYPMLFEIRNELKDRISHCGVSEFTAKEGSVFLPKRMMENLQLQDGDLVKLKYASLEKGTYIKLQPHSMDFLGLVNPKAALEETLSSKFFCLTSGDTIVVNHNHKTFLIDVVETKPASAVSIIDTDCEVEFAPPLDYKEPGKHEQSVEKEVSRKGSKFMPFTGLARRLDEKASVDFSSTGPSSVEGDKWNSGVDSSIAIDADSSIVTKSESMSCKRPGKMVFGSSEHRNNSRNLHKGAQAESQKKEPFQPFTGKKYTLGG